MSSEEKSGEEPLMSSAEDSHASPTPMQESGWARRTSATYGLRCFALYERSGLATSWGRTLLGCLLGTAEWSSKRCYLTWRQKVIGPSRRLSFQLLAKALPIEGTEYGLLRTPNAQDPGINVDNLVTKDGEPAKIGERAYDRNTGRLAQVGITQQAQMLVRTPTTAMLNADRAKDPEYANRKISKGQTITLADQAKMGLLPTPMAQDERTATEEQTLRRKEVYGGTKRAMYLNNYLSLGMLPTPNSAKASNDTTLAKSGDGRSKPNKLGWALAEGMLPTPAASNPNDGESPETWHKRAEALKEKHGNGNGAGTPLSIAVQDATGLIGLLNHRYVMEMMGFPPDWCDIPPQKLKPFVSKRSTRAATPSSRKSPMRSSRRSKPASNSEPMN